MRPRRLSEIADLTGGRLVGEDALVESIATDSRSTGAHALFVALPGDHHDGHDFLSRARAAGAAGALVERDIPGEGSQVVVDDPLGALQSLAADERRATNKIVVGVTGSAGKTLTKDLIAGAVGAGRVVHAASGSYNNELGLPLTLLSAAPDAEVIVTEMGSRGVGHIAALCAIAQPDIGVVTNVGLAHVEIFGSPEKIAQGKAELVEALPSEGLAVLNDDDPVVRDFGLRTSARVVRYGTSAGADVRAHEVELTPEGLAHFSAEASGQRVEITMPMPGEHMVHNALAALAVAVELGVPLELAARGMEATTLSGWRMEVTETTEGVSIINDAYNANPASMSAALKSARWIARDRRLIAVLGAMRELGDHSFVEHEKIGEMVARLRVEELLTVGEEAAPIARAAVREGAEPDHVRSVDDLAQASLALRNLVAPKDVVLLKGSRAVGLEALVEAIG